MNSKQKIYVVLDNIRSLYNVGSFFRSADAAGCVKKIYLTGMTGYPKDDPDWIQTKRIAKTSLGAEKYINWQYHKNPIEIIKMLKKKNINIYCLENNIENRKPKNIFKTNFRFPCALVFGHEVRGVNDKIINISDELIQIPMRGKKESLNVASSFAIAIYQLSNQIYDNKKKD